MILELCKGVHCVESRRVLSNAYLLAKCGFDTAEKEPSKVCPLDRQRPDAFRPGRFEQEREKWRADLGSASRAEDVRAEMDSKLQTVMEEKRQVAEPRFDAIHILSILIFECNLVIKLR